MKLSRLLPAIAILVLGFIFPGCSANPKTTPTSTTTSTAKRDAKLFVVSVESTAFFRHGPQAGRDPDSKLARETVLKLIRPSFGYSKVEIAATGEQGYVSSEDIRPTSSGLIAAASPAAPKNDPLATPSATPAVEQFNLNSDDPRLVPPPEALPPAELPAPAPSPEP